MSETNLFDSRRCSSRVAGRRLLPDSDPDTLGIRWLFYYPVDANGRKDKM